MTDEHKQKEFETIAAGRAVKEVLESEPFRAACREVEKKYLAEFREADTDDKRRTVWAKSGALIDVLADLQAVFASGTLASHQRSTREAAEAARAERTTRK